MKRTHKLSLLFAILFLFAGNRSFSQSIKEFFTNNSLPLTYLGIDYTKARLINDPGGNPADIKARLYGSMNDLVVNEPDNYKIAAAFNRNGAVTNDISAVREKNDKINAGDIMSSNAGDYSRLTEADIAATVRALNLKAKEGVGLVFIMEGMKKEEKKSFGSVWVTLIDMKTKNVLMTERMEQEAAGFGFRNFWASIIKKTIIEINKKKYKGWEKKYSS